jgi:manganese-dependent ADP-ribose/CDP-alcohol diphosphatase
MRQGIFRLTISRALACLGGGSIVVLNLPRMIASAEPHKKDDPLFRFGVIADVQWADVEDGYNYARTSKRCYRGALGVLRSAIDFWQPLKLDFVAQLGDLIDGQNAQRGMSVSAMDAATALLSRLPCRIVNIVGNHELYNFDRVALAERLDVGSGRRGDPPSMRREYFSFKPADGWRVIALDSYQESVQGWAADDPRARRALKTLAANNPNIDPDNPGKNGNWFAGMPSGYVRRFVPYNGAYGREQLKWLRHELRQAAASGERVILLSHTILAPQACEGTTMAFDYDEALEIVRESGRTVAMVFCGHDHAGGYHRDPETGTHHLTLCSPLNLGTNGKAFGIVDVTDEHIELRGPVLRDLLPPSKEKGVPQPVPCGRLEEQGARCEVMRFELKK